jgi:hypothetical protein
VTEAMGLSISVELSLRYISSSKNVRRAAERYIAKVTSGLVRPYDYDSSIITLFYEKNLKKCRFIPDVTFCVLWGTSFIFQSN